MFSSLGSRVYFGAGLYLFVLLLYVTISAFFIKEQRTVHVDLNTNFISSIKLYTNSEQQNPAITAENNDGRSLSQEHKEQSQENINDIFNERIDKIMTEQKKMIPIKVENGKASAVTKDISNIIDESSDSKQLDTIKEAANYEGHGLNNPTPKYPIVSRQFEEGGTVILNISISRDGIPTDIIIEQSSGFFRLDNAAIYAVQKWKFIPAKSITGENIASIIKIPFEFKFQNNENNQILE